MDGQGLERIKAEFEAQLKAKDMEITFLKTSVDELRDARKIRDNFIDDLRQSQIDLREEKSSLQNKQSKLQEELQQARNKLETSEDVIKNQQITIKSLSECLQSYEARLNSQSVQLDAVDVYAQEGWDSVTEFQFQHDNLRVKLAALENQNKHADPRDCLDRLRTDCTHELVHTYLYAANIIWDIKINPIVGNHGYDYLGGVAKMLLYGCGRFKLWFNGVEDNSNWCLQEVCSSAAP
ncbi:hypothetical protein F53441_12311 [Fusarium austroafricanum]|uniref:Uncharacterized protein n=1 Tax=Fusarium austroafricanum TaxID=2364996 RepID=A0A8H4K0F1_9HYPO|nr:hypothetical protein F53441_12311 [Fusarium austroafricanum]